ncbi:DUF6701 domain-containing protein [Marinobacter sp. HL-58]|uniref:DUF6701 domain-containing protein n=1 Tax=Marinobacter sp. HL-58 TaxID=1479237 RepID=UPI0006907EAF|nr:DUF6701 domain-containing protein [Marinobacter sp. HL-58]KPQ01954.1 MAG: T2bSS MSH-type system biogenesis protein MshQ [Marinobacter sp. HL-58]
MNSHWYTTVFSVLVFSFVLLPTPAVNAQDASGPIGEWRMDEDSWEGAANEVFDSSGNGFNGRAATNGSSGSLPDTDEGKVCNSGYFRGQGFSTGPFNQYVDAQHYVEISDGDLLSPLAVTEAMSIGGWFRADQLNGTLLHKGQGGATQEYQVKLSGGQLQVTFWDANGSPYTVSANAALQVDQWYYFGVTAHRPNGNRLEVQITVLDESGQSIGVGNDNWNPFFAGRGGKYSQKPTTGSLLFAAESFGPQSRVNFFAGRLDEIRLHQRVLTDSEIQNNALETRPCKDNELQCFNDDFAAGSLSDDWVTSVSSGNFTPRVESNGRLRMTQAVGNQSTAATLQREIPGADNLVILEFDYYAYGGNGADGIVIALSDSRVTPQPGSFGGSLGYAQRNNGDAGFAGGWMGVGLDEFGNYSNQTEGRQGGVGFVPQAVVVRGSGSGQSGYKYLEGTSGLSPGIDETGSDNPHRYRITVDSRSPGEAIVSVERDTGGGMNTLIPPFDMLADSDQAPVPENFLLSLTGSTGGSTNIHELDEIELCALQLNPVGEQVDHFEILHDGVALTCQPETVTVRACANENCDQLFTDPVQATLSPSEGWEGGNVIDIARGTGQATLQNTVAGEVTLDVVGSEPSTRPQAVTLCQIGGGNLSAANCGLEFFDSGLAFEVPDLTSHRPSGPIEVRAVRRDEETQACVPAFENVEKPVRFWSTYVDPGPNGRPVSRALNVDDTDISGDPGNPTILDLDFGAGGVAEIDVRYPDAGQMQLNGTYLGSEATEDDGLVMPGSDQFVSVPAGLCVSSPGECAAGDASCPLFVKAGEEFDLTVTAVGWQNDGDSNLCEGNPNTPNFRLLDIPLSSGVVAPTGGADGTLTPESYTHTRSADATETLAARVSEVGVFRFSATPAAGSYLGKTVPPGISAPVGRFYPDRFNVVIDSGELEPMCSIGTPFTYTGQAIGWALPPNLEIEPLSVQGTRTLNYTETGFQRLSVADVVRSFPVADSSALNRDSGPLAVTTDIGSGVLGIAEPGLLSFDYGIDDTVQYSKLSEARVAPIEPDLEFSVDSVTDADGVSASSSPYRFTPLADFEVRYGRLSMDNVYGPENIDELQMPFRLEYWNGSRFTVNTADSCTPWTTSDISGTTDHHTLATDSGTFINGEAGPLSLEPSGSQGTDTLIWGVEEWLQDDTDDDGTLENPSALATFGVYRGHDRIIYWRER